MSLKSPRHVTVVVRAREKRLKELATADVFVGATLVRLMNKCGRKGCHCATGEGHPTYYLKSSRKGKMITRYVSKDRLDEVRAWIREYKRVKRLVGEITDLTLELMAAEAQARRKEKRRQRRR
jgi:hypothetical protein